MLRSGRWRRPQIRGHLATQTLPNSRPTVALETHGCKLNQADTSRLARQFVEAGFRVVDGDEGSDVYVVNSCTVTHVADRKARHALKAARRRNPGAVVVATGCYAQRSPDLLRRLEEVDLVVGNADKEDLVRRVTEWRGEPPVPCAVGDDAPVLSPRISRTRAMVKIQEGCNQVCAYCIVPKVRGRERSIPPEEILAEVDRHVEDGYKEVVLTGTQLGSYGFDLADVDLTTLVERILSETQIARLRISSLQPQEIDERMLGVWSDPRLCPHFHLPLQSGSDGLLKRMRRRYTSRLYAETVEKIRRCVPDVSVTTDVIAGFPGETEADFQQTYALCRGMAFSDAHVFPYSVRPGTSAAHLDGHVASDVKARRVQALLGLSEKMATRFRMGFAGKVRSVLWESGTDDNGSTLWSGLTDNYIRVECRSDRPLANVVTQARLSTSTGEVVQAEAL